MSGILAELVLSGNVVQWQACSLYADSHPMVEQHHVCPDSWWRAAGKPVASPMRTLCPNCHYGVHVAIDGIIRGYDLHLMKPRWIELAQAAFVIAQQNGLTPAPTL